MNIYRMNGRFQIPEEGVRIILNVLGSTWDALYVPPSLYTGTPLGTLVKAFHVYRNSVLTGTPALCISEVLLWDEDLDFLRRITWDTVLTETDTTRLGRLLKYFYFEGV